MQRVPGVDWRALENIIVINMPGFSAYACMLVEHRDGFRSGQLMQIFKPRKRLCR